MRRLQFIHPHVKCVTSVWSPSELVCLCVQLEEMIRLHTESAQSADAAAAASAAGGHHHKPKMQQAYGKAIDSISKYPLPITSAEEAEELQGSQTHKRDHGGWIRSDCMYGANTDTDACAVICVCIAIASRLLSGSAHWQDSTQKTGHCTCCTTGRASRTSRIRSCSEQTSQEEESG